ncbi:hypothetical protein FD01_GL000185 [Lacticaseibacillus manihotivorans DSM 13343 = JCM 12514]|uniref:GGDEF domain-containing protein n=1 Tax=Lacticaseibacillus manihotivorans DSM 13343 = JCM 12514 TaxID=1423769 RepID=A0A0R1R3K2_9LACO|nr:hypothetical protein FD01_GL000185 [Lacticaseibacillus manihotivorans DSM 13343 = JCM 12514]
MREGGRSVLADLIFYLCFFMTGFVGTVDTIHEMVPHAYAMRFNKHMPDGLPIVLYLVVVVALIHMLPLSPWIKIALSVGAVIHLSTRAQDPRIYGLGLVAGWLISLPLSHVSALLSLGSLAVLALVALSNYHRMWVAQREWRVMLNLVGLSAGLWSIAALADQLDGGTALAAWALCLPVLYAAHWYDRVMIVRHHENQRLFYSSAHDELTGVRTLSLFRRDYRRYQTLLRSDPQKPLHLAMVDIDHFKMINDTYGHLVGNEVLISFAKDFETYLAQKDYYCGLYRIGGEEFSVYLYSLSATDAKRELETYTQRLKTLQVSKTYPDLRITLSMGMCQCLGISENLVNLIGRADENLYRAKHLGRDQIIAA